MKSQMRMRRKSRGSRENRAGDSDAKPENKAGEQDKSVPVRNLSFPQVYASSWSFTVASKTYNSMDADESYFAGDNRVRNTKQNLDRILGLAKTSEKPKEAEY